MAQADYRFSELDSGSRQAPPVSWTIDATAAPALRYGPRRPWVVAIVLSSAMWVGIGWAIWSAIS